MAGRRRRTYTPEHRPVSAANIELPGQESRQSDPVHQSSRLRILDRLMIGLRDELGVLRRGYACSVDRSAIGTADGRQNTTAHAELSASGSGAWLSLIHISEPTRR